MPFMRKICILEQFYLSMMVEFVSYYNKIIQMWPVINYSMIRALVFIYISINLLSYYTTAQPNLNSRICQDEFGNYTSNSTFARNVQTLLSNITSNTKIDYGFYNFSVGTNLDIVNGIGLCRPDVLVSDCRQCLQEAALAITEQCPNQKDAIGWYDTCMIRYTDRYIFGKMELTPWYHLQAVVLGVDMVRFNQTAATLLTKLQVEAASGDSRLKYGAGTASVTRYYKIYALVQCTPDLDYFDCYSCLDSALGFALTTLYGNQSRVCFVICNIRIESFLFYDPTTLITLKPPSSLPPPVLDAQPPSSTHQSKGMSRTSKILLVVPVPVITFILLLLAFIGHYTLRRRTKRKNKFLRDDNLRNPESLQMDFETIKVATENFSLSNKLGQGGFGAVYKGKLANGQEIAVKRLSQNSGQGEEEFKNEAILVDKLRHRNLVRFLGFSLEGEERLLIYELLPNKSLDYFLFDPVKRSLLDWETRHKIIGGIARGLLYLHEDSRLLVVHRDLKASNILLDEEMNPKISDFGMARLFGVDQTRADTSRICGTYGYMPPEYVQQGHFSIKSDVYSFGVLVLEIISGLRINSFYNSETGECLLSYAWRNWLENTTLNIVDSSMPSFERTEVMRCINIGLLCVQENFIHRPLMSTIIVLLNSQYTNPPPNPSRPAFLLTNDDVDVDFDESKIPLHYQSSAVVSSIESKNEASVSELDPR